MRIRIAAPVLVGALALGAVALPTAASAATAAPVITKAVAPSVVLGLRGKVTLAVTVSASDAGGVKAIYAEPYPAAFYKAHGLTLTAAEVKDAGNLLKVKASTATTQTAGLSVTENVTTNADLPPNALAGAWGFAVVVVATDGSTTFNAKATTFSFKRADTLTAKVSATKVRKGANLTVKGLLKRVNWDKHVYQGYAGQYAQLQFRKTGSKVWAVVKSVRSGAAGTLTATVKDTKSGTWRYVYVGNGTSGAAVSGQTWVGLK